MQRIYSYHILVLWIFIASTEAFQHIDQFLTVTEIVRRNPGFSKLETLLRRTELGFKLDQSRDLTFLAPDNVAIEETAFDQIGGNYLKYGETLQVLSNHVIPKVVKIVELTDGVHDFETLAGSTLRLQVSRKRGEAANVFVSVFDSTSHSAAAKLHNDKGVEAVNGMVYSISKLLIPGHLEEAVETARKKMEAGNPPDVDLSVENQSVVDNQGSDVFGVPEHVQATNRVHWSEKDASSASAASPAAVAIAIEDNNDQSDSNALSSSNRPKENVVGVLYSESVNDDNSDDDADGVVAKGLLRGEEVHSTHE